MLNYEFCAQNMLCIMHNDTNAYTHMHACLCPLICMQTHMHVYTHTHTWRNAYLYDLENLEKSRKQKILFSR